MSNIIELLEEWLRLNPALNLNGLNRVLPFCCTPRVYEKNDYIEFIYSLGEEYDEFLDKLEINKDDDYIWLIIPNLNVYFKIKYLPTAKFATSIGKPTAGTLAYPEIYMKNSNIPSHVLTFCEYIKKKYKRSFIEIHDYLPREFSITVYTKFSANNKKFVQDTLLMMSELIIKDPIHKKDVDKTIKDSTIPLKEKIEKLIILAGSSVSYDYCYCLACGKKIDYKRKFCDSTKYKYKNRDNCRNKFNYWLKARLGLTETNEVSNKRDYYNKVLIDMIEKYPLTAFDKFKIENQILYDNKN